MKRRFLLLTAPLVAIGLLLPAAPLGAAGGKVQVLKFEANWCGACRKMKPVYSRVSRQLSSQASFRSVNVDRQSSLADRYGIRTLPTVVVVKNGRVVGRKSGYLNESRLSSFVRRHL